uniref:AMP-activated protein kinase glycogen-binding domain-containing protein n=1 Tax=Kalanchoe fedtschenkoi TaxID=63787 RepID=A0A7N0SWK9_KALFE
MAAPSPRFPTLLFPSSRHFSPCPHHPVSQSFHLYSNPTRKRFTLCASSIKKPRASRKTMTDEELCNDLRQFSLLHGLEDGQVPSMKELSTHGRKDLANIVRRRGYRLVGELLLKSLEMNEFNREEHFAPQIEAVGAAIDQPLGQGEETCNEVECAALETEVASLTIQDLMTSTDFATTKNTFLEEKVSTFIQNGHLDIFEDELHTVDATDAKEDEHIKPDTEVEFSFNPCSKDDTEDRSEEHGVSALFNGRAPVLGARRALRDVNPSPIDTSDSTEDQAVKIRRRENQDEINHLKFELHQKELELSKLKEQIEKEKVALSLLQTRAEAEINKAQKLVEEKDAELIAVEENLSGLKEVQVQFRGEGTTVEVAGSFNGWHHQIKMDPQSKSSHLDSTGSGKHRLWSTTLWLYPGVYEIKFIVDGHWRVDLHSESVTRGTIHNNILRVER